jgi:SSS family solute:Na+ symporter
LISKANKERVLSAETNDKDYVFIHFILNNLPRGLIGLLLAVILSAAMSSTASELNALSSTTTMDLYKRSFVQNKDEKHYLKASKWFTLAWGFLAILIASVAYLADNLIQLVNIIGSIFYGNILGIFFLAFFFKYVKGNAVFISALITQIIILSLYFLDEYQFINLPYLWLNFVGCFLAIIIAMLIDFKKLSKNNQLILYGLISILAYFGYLIYKNSI